ncbi:ABC transporter substrate-binding protein [Actinoplanes sp. SE50]|uniref:ABC transporter substrate-binding protein n=1 Tax=unclassified Actinoplanes TaxID=2626549 RepID=UPI00023ECFF8|nr:MULTISPECIES: ABC transporter substrate-binding protein [unclassified Actinoplanes]AEV82721.1 Membrane-bound lytic murein transglycosylase F [Actinoplanes sp. SE50/110]ATO81117.1 ABC transporter substrate-binding protein [Actinoplanes sp. SE50]SLL98524.1 ABC-type polar amino acid transporter, substrate-binding lipoprotein [Actinoplanes sp. SE50/110]
MFRITPGRRAILGVAVAAALTVSLSACGKETDTSSGSAAAPSASTDTSLAGKVPADIKAAGKLVIGTDSSYAPSEFLDTDGKTVTGFDVDLFNAVGQKLGLTTEWQSATFDSIIPGVSSGKYTVGVSSFTINPDRLKVVNMISYFSAGTQWAAKAGSTLSLDDACGKKIAVQTATVQVDDLTARSKKCTTAGKAKITVDQYQKQSDATNAVVTGKDEAMLADSPVVAYAVKQTNGQLALLGDIYDSAPYGYVVDKKQTEFANVIAEAVKSLIADGTYKTILDKWGVAAGGITTPAVNPAS